MSTLPHSPSDLEQIYRTRFSENVDYRVRIWQVLTAYFARWVPPNAAVLDLGCGYCEFINQVRAGRKYAMDLNPDLSSRAAAGTTILKQDCSAPWQVESDSLDVVFTSNFFEHLPTKAHLQETLMQAARCLKKGGRLIAMGPNIRHLPGAYWDFMDHYLPLTDRSLAELLKTCGFQIEVSYDRFLPYRMSGRRKFPIWTVRLYLAVPLAWRILGRQFLIVARKAG